LLIDASIDAASGSSIMSSARNDGLPHRNDPVINP